MGAVYLARREGAETPVALKILPQKFSEDESHVARFQREAMISIRLTHPNLVKGHEYGQAKGRWYYAMEFVQGRTVSALIKEKKVLDEKEAAGIALQVARAVGEIHRHGLVHRDIKPDNVMIDARGVARVMDLGLIKSFATEHTRLTQTGYALGTLHYMSPEQLQGSRGPGVDGRSDLFSLGAMLYHMVSGQIPFTGDSMVEIMDKQLKHELEPPRKFRPGLSDGICRVIEKLMAPDPADRYPAAAAVEDDLNLILQGKQPRARLVRRTRKSEPPKPKRIGLAVGAGIGAAGLGLVAAIVLLSGGNPPSAPSRTPASPRPVDRFPGLLSQAEAAAQAKEWSKALAAVEEALKLRPGDAQAAEIKSRVEREQKYESAVARAGQFIATAEWAKAESAAGEALELKPADPAALELRSKVEEGRRTESYRQAMTLAETCLQDREWDQAREACRQAMQVRPGDEAARKLIDRIASEQCASIVARAETLLKDKEWEKALQEIDRALAVKPGDRGAGELKQRVEQGKLDHLVGILVAGADAALAVKKWDEAREACKKALVFKPGDAALLALLKKTDDAQYADALSRADQYFKAREWSSALAAADEALSIRPADPAALQLKKRIDESGPAARYRDAMARAEKHAAAGEWVSAARAVDEALQARSGDEKALKLKETIAGELKDHRYKDAVRRGDQHIKAKEWAKAASAFTEALDEKAGDPKARDGLDKARAGLAGEVSAFRELQELSGHSGIIVMLDYSPDGKLLASASNDRTVKIWNVDSGQCVKTLNVNTGWIGCVAFSPTGGRLVTGGEDAKIRVWDTSSWAEVKVLESHRDPVASVAFSKDGKRMISCGSQGEMKIWDTKAWKQGYRFGHATHGASRAALSPDGQWMVTSGSDKNVIIWDADKPEARFTNPAGIVFALGISPDGRSAAAAGNEDGLKIWDIDTGKEIRQVPGLFRAIAWSGNGKWLALGDDKKVRILDSEGGVELKRLTGHGHEVHALAFSPDSKRLASGSLDTKIKIWGK
jgi:WD40 repeat protein/tetratricopeptide (TPR) repeat protein